MQVNISKDFFIIIYVYYYKNNNLFLLFVLINVFFYCLCSLGDDNRGNELWQDVIRLII